MKVQNFLEVKECVGKSCIEDELRPGSAAAAPIGWPVDGSIEMKDVYFDYRMGAPCALNGVSVQIESGEKIGVCGRTGAGKSTLLSVLFSLGPLNKGTVTIGGKSAAAAVVPSQHYLAGHAVGRPYCCWMNVSLLGHAGEDLAKISCHEVRAQVAIVPQSPTLFDGTIRENLIGGNRIDASQGGDDSSLLETLRTCRLGVLAERGLDGTLGQLSDGQRQLFCVARALVRRPKILVRLFPLNSVSQKFHQHQDLPYDSLKISFLFFFFSFLVSRQVGHIYVMGQVLDESTADLDQDSANELLRVIDENFRDTTVRV